MITALDFVDLDTFRGIQPAPDLAAISIGDEPDSRPANLDGFGWCARLEFLDLDHYNPAQRAHLQLVVEDALDFLHDLHRQTAPYRLVVHCTAGMSRSAAIALVAQAVAGLPEFPRGPDALYANEAVLEAASGLLGRRLERPVKASATEPHEFQPPRFLV